MQTASYILLNPKRAYSLIELLVVMAFFMVLLHLSYSNMLNFGQGRILKQSSEDVKMLIQDAQTKASVSSSISNSKYNFGVVFETDRSRFFASMSDYASREQSEDYEFIWPENIQSENVSLPDSCIQNFECIIFAKASGLASASGQLLLKDINTNDSIMIKIKQNGLVE